MPKWLDDYLIKLSQDKEDRYFAIVEATALENLLSEVIESFMVNDNKKVQTSLDDDIIWGTFNVKIQLAYCLGLISKDEQHDLNIIRKIRNEFAHQSRQMSFDDDQQISNLCRSLKLPQRLSLPKLTPKGMIFSSYFILGQLLEIRVNKSKEKRCEVANELQEAYDRLALSIASKYIDFSIKT